MATQAEAFQRAYGTPSLAFYAVSITIDSPWHLHNLSSDLELNHNLTASTPSGAQTEADSYLSETMGLTKAGQWAENPGQEFTSVWVNIPT